MRFCAVGSEWSAGSEARFTEDAKDTIQVSDSGEIYCDLAFSSTQVNLHPGIEAVPEVFRNLIQMPLPAPTGGLDRFDPRLRRGRSLGCPDGQILVHDLVGKLDHARLVSHGKDGSRMTGGQNTSSDTHLNGLGKLE